jgi:hypothetical protein
VLTVLRGWGDRWAVDAPPTAFEHSCGHDLDPAVTCRHCGAEIVPGELRVRGLTYDWGACAARSRNTPGTSSPSARAFSSAADHQARSSSMTSAAALVIRLTG